MAEMSIREILSLARRMEDEYQLPTGLLEATFLRENGLSLDFDPETKIRIDKVGARGDTGVMQVRPRAALADAKSERHGKTALVNAFGEDKGLELYNKVNAKDFNIAVNVEDNLRAAATYYTIIRSKLPEEFKSDIATLGYAFNAGWPNAVEVAKGAENKLRKPAFEYGNDVATKALALKSASGPVINTPGTPAPVERLGLATLRPAQAIPMRGAGAPGQRGVVNYGTQEPGVGISAIIGDTLKGTEGAGAIGSFGEGIDAAVARTRGASPAGVTPREGRWANSGGVTQALRNVGGAAAISPQGIPTAPLTPALTNQMQPRVRPGPQEPAAPTLGVQTLAPPQQPGRNEATGAGAPTTPAEAAETPWYKEMWDNPNTYEAMTKFGLALAAGKTGNVMQDLANAGLVTQDYMAKMGLKRRELGIAEAKVAAALQAAVGDSGLTKKAMEIIPEYELMQAANDPKNPQIALTKLFAKYGLAAHTGANLARMGQTYNYVN